MVPQNAFGSGTERHYRPPVVFQFNHDHAQWDRILDKVVTTSGRIDFDQLKKNTALLRKYVNSIQSVARTEFYEFNQDEKNAFLINAHNALFLKQLLESGQNLLTLNDSTKIEMFGDTISVADFHQKFIRRRISDPRAFLALSCLKPSCPAIYSKAIHPERIESQIEEVTVAFFKDRKRNYYSSSDKELVLSTFLKKFEYEITKKYGSMGSFASSYMSSNQEFRRRARVGLIKIKYQD